MKVATPGSGVKWSRLLPGGTSRAPSPRRARHLHRSPSGGHGLASAPARITDPRGPSGRDSRLQPAFFLGGGCDHGPQGIIILYANTPGSPPPPTPSPAPGAGFRFALRRYARVSKATRGSCTGDCFLRAETASGEDFPQAPTPVAPWSASPAGQTGSSGLSPSPRVSAGEPDALENFEGSRRRARAVRCLLVLKGPVISLRPRLPGQGNPRGNVAVELCAAPDWCTASAPHLARLADCHTHLWLTYCLQGAG